MYFVYVLRCVDSSLYCGYTTDISHRVKSHLGEVPGGAKYTKSRPPVGVERVWTTENKGDALKLESLIKTLKKSEKEALISGELSFAEAFGERIGASVYGRACELEGDLEKITVRQVDHENI